MNYLVSGVFLAHISFLAKATTYSLRCNHVGKVELTNKETGKITQVEKEPKITIGTKKITPGHSFLDAEVFRADKKQYRFTFEKHERKVEIDKNYKKITYDCKGVRYDLDGSVTKFCQPWTEVFKIGKYGSETFLGYEKDGAIVVTSGVRFTNEFPDGTIVESMMNSIPRTTFETANEIWKIYHEYRNCVLTPPHTM